ncbi:ATP-binding cassette domain-containing protein [Salinicola sp. JS01]|uniref:oligopeptide/dipeptide ABC transporter ATP-binding protein n=1 Tax=Salinicola sp. JS01 TaxID=3050071 RepID=UPI00255BBC4A|nr:oligopeptide/dipeptide ABC transporter ATP-binding protein [Salinicola sp. JS01]WIX34665.1 ATP-binding cassette domain-containing protein [Salinicola sp. JS01]
MNRSADARATPASAADSSLAALGEPADIAPPLLEVRALSHRYRLPRGVFGRRRPMDIQALNAVSLTLWRGDALCVVGESGSGKSTLARLIMGLLTSEAGEVHYAGTRIDHLEARQRQRYRRRMQMIFQDPYASLNPRLRIAQALEEPIHVHFPEASRQQVRERVEALMSDVGLDRGWGERYPHELSGGQRQRVAIARALSVSPELIVADEPLSALDLSVQAQVLNLLVDTQLARRLTYLFISHDLAVVEYLATHVAVLYRGTLCEVGPAAQIFGAPRHPYTRALLAARPRFDEAGAQGTAASTDTPADIAATVGCVYSHHCPLATPRCAREPPRLQALGDGHAVACHALDAGAVQRDAQAHPRP